MHHDPSTSPIAITCLLLSAVFAFAVPALPTPWMTHPVTLVVLGLVVVGLFAGVAPMWAVPFGLMLVLTWTLAVVQRYHAPGRVHHIEVTHHTQDRSTTHRASSSTQEIHEGFANASRAVKTSLSKQREATRRLNHTMRGAKVNANTIAGAMNRFQDIHYRKKESAQKMDAIRKRIETFREKYVNADGGGQPSDAR